MYKKKKGNHRKLLCNIWQKFDIFRWDFVLCKIVLNRTDATIKGNGLYQ